MGDSIILEEEIDPNYEPTQEEVEARSRSRDHCIAAHTVSNDELASCRWPPPARIAAAHACTTVFARNTD